MAWLVLAGSRRERPGSGTVEAVNTNELWVAVPGEWWVLCGYMDTARSLNEYKVHSSAPFEAPEGDDEIAWVGLDLDFEITGAEVDLQDESQFHDHAHTMGPYASYISGALIPCDGGGAVDSVKPMIEAAGRLAAEQAQTK